MLKHSPNGTPPAPPTTSGAFATSRQPTEFLPDLPVRGAAPWLYQLHHQELAGVPLLRVCYGLLLATALWLATNGPAGWVLAGLALFALAALLLLARRARRHSFVTFHPGPSSPVSPTRQSPATKIPLYVTGLLGVEGKQAAFTGLPAFYRSFATREHALFCLVRRRRLAALASWCLEEEGLWYAFIQPAHLLDITPGELDYGTHRAPALAVTYRPQPGDLGQGKRKAPATNRLYLAFRREEDRLAVHADLLADSAPALSARSSS